VVKLLGGMQTLQVVITMEYLMLYMMFTMLTPHKIITLIITSTTFLKNSFKICQQ